MIESVKIAADVYTPVSGEVVAVNEKASEDPSLVNERAEETWLYEIKCDKEPPNLMSSEEY